jgi:diguanylate cyclase (GGDEF)-like protein
VPVSASFGVAAVGDGEKLEFERLLGQADEALYRAKAAGRNRVCGPDDHAFAVLAD